MTNECVCNKKDGWNCLLWLTYYGGFIRIAMSVKTDVWIFQTQHS